MDNRVYSLTDSPLYSEFTIFFIFYSLSLPSLFYPFATLIPLLLLLHHSLLHLTLFRQLILYFLHLLPLLPHLFLLSFPALRFSLSSPFPPYSFSSSFSLLLIFFQLLLRLVVSRQLFTLTSIGPGHHQVWIVVQRWEERLVWVVCVSNPLQEIACLLPVDDEVDEAPADDDEDHAFEGLDAVRRLVRLEPTTRVVTV